MSVVNLHSLLNGRWFINQEYGQTLLPSLHNLLNGKEFTPPTNTDEANIVLLNNSGTAPIASGSFNTSDNKHSYALIVSIKNPIFKYNQDCGPRGTKSKMALMARNESDPNLKGVVLDIDSGGGQVAGTPEFYDFIKNYSKPVVAYTDGLLASAAYYFAAGAKHIIANKRADAIGSIGTMVSFIDFTGFYEKKGAKVVTEYATKSTDKNKDFQELLKGNPEGYIKNQLDPITDTFIADIQGARKEVSEKVFKGATYNAQKALKLGLIDQIGTLQDAIDKVFSLAEAQNIPNVNTNSKITMKKLPLVKAALNQEADFEATAEGIYLSAEQLDAIEASLATAATKVTVAQKAQSTAEIAKTAAEDNVQIVQESITAALKEAEVENHADLDTVEGVQALSALIKEYGKEDGAAQTAAKLQADADDANPNIVGGIDISAAMNS